MLAIHRFFGCPVAAVVFGIGTLSAHDPYEITADVRQGSEQFELTVTLARFTAMQVCSAETGGRKVFGPNQFDEIKPALENCGRGLFVITGGGERLLPKTSEASLTMESDIELKLVFPRPIKTVLRFDAVFLRILDDPGYGVTVNFFEHGNLQGHHVLRAAESVVEFPLPLPQLGPLEKNPKR